MIICTRTADIMRVDVVDDYDGCGGAEHKRYATLML